MIGCVLLAGGKSSRMNNVDKTLIEINNKTLLSIIINKLNFDKNNIVWENAENKESSRANLICKLKDENKFRSKR